MRQSFIDQKWFQPFRKEAGFSFTDYFIGDKKRRAKEQKRFLAGDVENPELDYPLLETFAIEKRETNLLALREEILLSEPHPLIQEAYKRVIDERLSHLRMLKATRDRDDRAFDAMTIKEYGLPSERWLKHLVPHIKSLIKQAKASHHPGIENSIGFLETLVSRLPAAKTSAIIPNFVPESDHFLSAKEIKKRFLLAFKRYGIKGWNVVIDKDSPRAFIHISQKDKKVVVPVSRTLSPQQLEALMLHEVGVHVRRNINAQKTNFQLLTTGLDHYLKGDEGLAKYEEARVFPPAMNASVRIYLGICLIKGLDGKKRNFREIFEIYRNYFYVYHFNRLDVEEEEANDRAWRRAVKFFRGTTGQSRGICLTKDLYYLEGYAGILETLKKYPKEKNRFFCGKYDPANPFHRELLDALDIH